MLMIDTELGRFLAAAYDLTDRDLEVAIDELKEMAERRSQQRYAVRNAVRLFG